MNITYTVVPALLAATLRNGSAPISFTPAGTVVFESKRSARVPFHANKAPPWSISSSVDPATAGDVGFVFDGIVPTRSSRTFRSDD